MSWLADLFISGYLQKQGVRIDDAHLIFEVKDADKVRRTFHKVIC